MTVWAQTVEIMFMLVLRLSICFHQNENETAHSSFCQSDMLSSKEQGARTYSVFNIHSNDGAASMFNVCFNKWTVVEGRKSKQEWKTKSFSIRSFHAECIWQSSACFLGKHVVPLQGDNNRKKNKNWMLNECRLLLHKTHTFII